MPQRLYNSGMASIRDVAKEAGVSPATVSRSFTSPGLINDETRNRVLDAARRLDYRPPRLRSNRPFIGTGTPHLSRHGVRNAVGPTNAIGFQFFHKYDSDPLHSNVFYAPMLAGAQAEAESLGLHLLIHTTNRSRMQDGLPRMVTEGAVGGLLLVGIADSTILRQFAEHLSTIVLVDNPDASGPYESLLSDGFQGGYMAARHVLTLGHRRLSFFLAEAETETFRDRMHGWTCAQFDAGVVPDPSLVVSGQNDDDRFEALSVLLRRPNRPTALMAANDHYALDALRVCRSVGLRVPEDISLIGFDDVRYSTASDPPLTTLHVDTVLLGRLAVRRLVARMQEGTNNLTGLTAVRYVLPVTFKERGSTAPVSIP
jgi:DNA-binding LacI/PurR family transcriptional regulator